VHIISLVIKLDVQKYLIIEIIISVPEINKNTIIPLSEHFSFNKKMYYTVLIIVTVLCLSFWK